MEPVLRRRRLAPAVDEIDYFTINISFARFYDLPPDEIKLRIQELRTIIQNITSVFGDVVSVAVWLLNNTNATLWNVFMKWINSPVSDILRQNGYGARVGLSAELRKVRATFSMPPPTRIRAAPFDNGTDRGSMFTFTHRDGFPHVRVFLTTVTPDVFNHVDQDLFKEDAATADLLAKETFKMGFDAMLEYLRNNVDAVDDEWYGLSGRMDAFTGNLITLSYPLHNIMYYRPAIYFLCGFSVIGQQFMIMLPDTLSGFNTSSITLTATELQQFTNIAHFNGAPPPYGPGVISWLIIGVFDRVVLGLSQGHYVYPVPDMFLPPFMTIIGTRANQTQYQWQLDLKPMLNPVYAGPNDIQAARAEIDRIFDEVYRMFETTYEDYYSQPVDRRVDNDNKIIKIELRLTGVQRRQVRLNQYVNGSNVFWENMVASPGGRFKGRKSQFVLFPSYDTLNNCYLKGCVQRALNCKCSINEFDMPVICSCPLPDVMEPVLIQDIPDLCKLKEDKFIIFVVQISKRDENGKTSKTVDLLHFGKNYYQGGKVLYVSQPDWERVQGHCALWLPKEEVKNCDNAAYSRFLAYGAFNKINHIFTGENKYNICPICGELYYDSNSWAHFVQHSDKCVCRFCGLEYDDITSLNEHIKYHCKRLPEFSAIILKDEPVEYEEKTGSEMWINVFADLESAISEPNAAGEREHINILIGWVDDYNKEVRIKKKIEDFFNSLIKIPATDLRIFFHNGEGYDFHFVIQELCALNRKFVKNFSIVGDSGQKVRYFSVTYKGKHFHFRDTFAFVSESLEKWVESSKKSGCTFPIFSSTFDDYKREILLRKNPFPYNAVLCPEDLNRPIEELYGWAKCDIAEELFCYKYTREELDEFAQWLQLHAHKCGWKKVGDYYIDYLKCDVAQLKDIMDFFANNVREEYDLDVYDYFGTPSLTWAAWLKQNKYPLDPILKPKHYDVINSTIRGGQTGAMTRLYDSSKEGGAMFDLDINSLYATVMLKFSYPCHDWKEENIPYPEDLLAFLERLHEEGRSAFIELDMTVKENPSYEDYVPIASKRRVKDVYDYPAMHFYNSEDTNSMYFQGLTQVYGKHEHYCCHSRNLVWYITHDIITIEHVYFILSGKDEPVFHDYVEHNLKKRAEFSGDAIKKMLYKLLNNALYGKTYEDETQRNEYCLEHCEDINEDDIYRVKRVISTMGEWTLYEANKKVFKVNKPVYLGACITEFSKLWMYQMYYDKIRIHYPDCRVYYTDTDAITVLFPTKVKTLLDVANELNTEDEQIIDTSNFSVIPTEKKHCQMNNQPGLFKSETGEHRILKFIGLRAKTYIMVCEDDFIKMSVKGCPLAEKSKLKWEDFEKVLMNPGEGMKIEFPAIRSKYHMVKSVILSKIVLSADDRKRYISDDLIHTYPLFSKQHMEAINHKNPLPL